MVTQMKIVVWQGLAIGHAPMVPYNTMNSAWKHEFDMHQVDWTNSIFKEL